jgi:hypothetical protein
MNRRCFLKSSCRAIGESRYIDIESVDISYNTLADSLIYIILIGREFEETNNEIRELRDYNQMI